MVALLDVTAAFDTVDHLILLERLSKSYGISGSAMKWLDSFVIGRRQRVRFGGSSSPLVNVRTGIPQGSVLGPLLYVLYTADIEDIV